MACMYFRSQFFPSTVSSRHLTQAVMFEWQELLPTKPFQRRDNAVVGFSHAISPKSPSAREKPEARPLLAACWLSA